MIDGDFGPEFSVAEHKLGWLQLEGISRLPIEDLNLYNGHVQVKVTFPAWHLIIFQDRVVNCRVVGPDGMTVQELKIVFGRYAGPGGIVGVQIQLVADIPATQLENVIQTLKRIEEGLLQ